MVELYHALRDSSSFQGSPEEWYDSILERGIESEKRRRGSGSEYVFLFDSECPPTDDFYNYPTVKVDVLASEIEVRSWWDDQGQGGKRYYEEWSGDFNPGTEFLVEDRVSPRDVTDFYSEGIPEYSSGCLVEV